MLTAPAAPPVTEEKARPAGELSAEEILVSSRTVMHGLGQLSGTSVLNCREGFDRYYARGARVFEVDLRMTSDGQVVLRHDWRGGWQEGISELSIPTRDAFLAAPLLERYTPMSFRDLLLLMEEYPERKIRVVDSLAASLGQGLLVYLEQLKYSNPDLFFKLNPDEHKEKQE